MQWSDLELPRLCGPENTLVPFVGIPKGQREDKALYFPRDTKVWHCSTCSLCMKVVLSRLLGPGAVVACVVMGTGIARGVPVGGPVQSLGASRRVDRFFPELSTRQGYGSSSKEQLLLMLLSKTLWIFSPFTSLLRSFVPSLSCPHLILASFYFPILSLH